jgi:hypothetical protein
MSERDVACDGVTGVRGSRQRRLVADAAGSVRARARSE